MATVTFTAAGEVLWTCPFGVTSVQAECWGAGGGGGGMNQNSDGGGGGGGGAYARLTALSVTPGTTYTVHVGAKGVGVAGADGTAGGDTWFSTSSTVLAKGGSPGSPSTGTPPEGGAGGLAVACIGDVLNGGGNGGRGRDSATGRGAPGGSSGGTAAVGTAGPDPWSTAAAASPPTGGGIGGNGGNGNGVAGSAPASGAGGGGGGAAEGTNLAGGAGADGKIVLTFSTPTAATHRGWARVALLGALTLPTALGGTIRAGPATTRGTDFNGSLPPVEVAGTARHHPRLASTGIVMVHRAAPVRAHPVLTGTFEQIAPLAGTVRSTARLSGTIVHDLPLAGVVHDHPRLKGFLSESGASPTALAGTGLATGRLQASSVILAYPSAPIRGAPARATGQLAITGLTTTPLAGTIRSTDRLRVLGIRLGYPVTPVRSVQRVAGSIPTFDKVAIAGRVRAPGARAYSPEFTTTFPAAEIVGPWGRLRGQLGFAQPAALRGTIRAVDRLTAPTVFTATPLAGTVRSTDRLTGFLARPLAGRVRDLPARLTGALVHETSLVGTVRATAARPNAFPLTFALHNPQIRGRVHATLPRLTATGPDSLQVLAGTVRALERVTGSFGQAQPIAGMVRENPDRLHGRLRSRLPLGGQMRAVAVVPPGALDAKQDLRGALQSSSRVTGTLVQAPALAGTVEAHAVLLGRGPTTGTLFFGSTSRATSRCYAVLSQRPALTGRIEAHARLTGFTGRRVFSGTCAVLGARLTVLPGLYFVPALPAPRIKGRAARSGPFVAPKAPALYSRKSEAIWRRSVEQKVLEIQSAGQTIGTAHVAGDYALSAGWGATAAIAAVDATDTGGRVTITANGGGLAATPTVTLTFRDGQFTRAPAVAVSRGDAEAPTTAFWIVAARSATAVTFRFVGTPVAATSYILDFVVGADGRF